MILMGEADLGALSAWMESCGLGAGEIDGVARLSGGTQNILLRFERAGRTYVLRRPPVHLRANSNLTMRREVTILAALAGTKVPHPRLIAACSDEAVLGAEFYLMEPVEGFSATAAMPTLHASSEAIRQDMGLSVIEGSATLHELDYRELGLESFGRPENFLARQVDRWRSQLAGYSDLPGWPGLAGLPGVPTVAGWLERHRPATFEAGIMHGDYHLGNVMFRNDGPQVAAIVDWELATIGDPLLDLGWLLATWQNGDEPDEFGVKITPWNGFPSPDDLIEHYRQRSRRDLSAIQWYAVLACFKLGIILEGTYARACAGQAPTDTGDRLHGHAISLFERAMRWVR